MANQVRLHRLLSVYEGSFNTILPDTLKGSYYANPLVDNPRVDKSEQEAHPEYYGRNIWPGQDEKGLEGYEGAFKKLGKWVSLFIWTSLPASNSPPQVHLQGRP